MTKKVNLSIKSKFVYSYKKVKRTENININI